MAAGSFSQQLAVLPCPWLHDDLSQPASSLLFFFSPTTPVIRFLRQTRHPSTDPLRQSTLPQTASDAPRQGCDFLHEPRDRRLWRHARTLHPSGTPVSMTSPAGWSHWTTRDDGGREVDRPTTTRLAGPWTVVALPRVHTWWQYCQRPGHSRLRLSGPSPALFPPPLARSCVARSLSVAGIQLVPESLKLIEPNHWFPAADRVTGFHNPSRLVPPQLSSRLGCRCYALSLSRSGPGVPLPHIPSHPPRLPESS